MYTKSIMHTAPPKPKKEKKSLKKVVESETSSQTFITRSMAAAAARGTTFFASLENPPPVDDLILPISSTVVLQQPSPTNTNSLPQPSMFNSVTVPQQTSSADVSSSTVPQSSIAGDVFYTVDDIFYETHLPSTADNNSTTVPQLSMNADDNFLLQEIFETSVENFVNQKSYQNVDQMEYVAGQYYISSDGAYVYFNGEVMIPVDPSEIYGENGMPENVDYPSVPEAVVDPSSLPTLSSPCLNANESSYPFAHFDTPNKEEMNHSS